MIINDGRLIMNRRILLRDYLIANIAGIIGTGILFVGIIMQEKGFLPKYPCMFLTATHMYCPGCGGSRALLSVLRLDLFRSLIYNPAVLLGALLLIYYELGVIITLVINDGQYHFCTKPWPVYSYVIVLL